MNPEVNLVRPEQWAPVRKQQNRHQESCLSEEGTEGLEMAAGKDRPWPGDKTSFLSFPYPGHLRENSILDIEFNLQTPFSDVCIPDFYTAFPNCLLCARYLAIYVQASVFTLRDLAGRKKVKTKTKNQVFNMVWNLTALLLNWTSIVISSNSWKYMVLRI